MDVRRPTPRRLIAIVVGVVVTIGLALVGPATSTAEAAAPKTTTLAVYNNNIENRAPCGVTDWNRLYSYIKKQSRKPDVFTVQQISNQDDLLQLISKMSKELPGSYAGIIAIADPTVNTSYTGPCSKYKRQQTNAIIYRLDRFTPLKITRWRSNAPLNKTGACKNLDDPLQDRVENVATIFRDDATKRVFSVASIHWPLNKSTNSAKCATSNLSDARKAFDRLDQAAKAKAVVRVLAGDTNAKQSVQNWWSAAKRYGYRDTVCPSGCASKPTSGQSRIDYILVKGAKKVANGRNISTRDTGGVYSDHLAQRADVTF